MPGQVGNRDERTEAPKAEGQLIDSASGVNVAPGPAKSAQQEAFGASALMHAAVGTNGTPGRLKDVLRR